MDEEGEDEGLRMEMLKRGMDGVSSLMRRAALSLLRSVRVTSLNYQ